MIEIEIKDIKNVDYYELETVTMRAFYNVYMPGCDEHYLVSKLKDDSSLIKELSFVAINKENNKIVGLILSEHANLILHDGLKEPILTFGPLGVDKDYQKQGIGGLLLNKVIETAKKMKFKAIGITGVPTYYPRFGFKSCFELNFKMPDGAQFPALMGLVLDPKYNGIFNDTMLEEPIVMMTSPTQKEIDEFDKLFPPLERKILPGQWKKLR